MDRTRGFGVYLDKTLKKIQQVYIEAFHKHKLDITIEQWVILQQIFLLGENATQAEVVRVNYRNRASTSRIISGLCKNDLVIRKPKKDYPNRFELVLTEKGKSLIKKATPIVEELREVAKKGIKDNEFETFLLVLNKLWENYDNYPS